ncbi:MAG: AAA family ATPase [Alphaproteobacteria bacterium]|nr:AAA family ATPase [Alphaproteobacteria bacterium]
MDTKTQQCSFIFEPKAVYSRQDFMVSNCNKEALRAVESWPQWPFFALSIYGPKGCGKTHLAHIFANQIGLKLNKPVRAGIIKACEIKTSKVARLYAQNPCLVVEDINTKADEEALFHLYNLYHDQKGFLLLTSRVPLARINFRLPDLKSRFKMVPSVAILEPDDTMLEALIVKLFSDRQIVISQEVLNYILQNMERSFSYAINLVERADELSLALKRAVTVPIIKKAMFDLSHNTQQELF